jgi:hypothetical protein
MRPCPELPDSSQEKTLLVPRRIHGSTTLSTCVIQVAMLLNAEPVHACVACSDRIENDRAHDVACIFLLLQLRRRSASHVNKRESKCAAATETQKRIVSHSEQQNFYAGIMLASKPKRPCWTGVFIRMLSAATAWRADMRATTLGDDAGTVSGRDAKSGLGQL